jgi:hypothetical protein
LQTVRDVALEHCDGACIFALSDDGIPQGLSLSVDVFAGKARQTLPAIVAECSPVMRAGTLRYRLRLATTAPAQPVDSDGLLVVDTPVRLLDISGGGLQLAAYCDAKAGTVGVARIAVEGTTYEGDVRVVRCTRVEGGAEPHRLGAEFLRTQRVPYGSPLRHALVALLRSSV